MTENNIVVVRPKISSTDEDPVSKVLGNIGLSKFAGCSDTYIGATYDRTLGRYLTGLDENHPDVLNLPAADRAAKQKEILEERAYLEKELGVSLHHTNEDYWSTIPMPLSGGRIFNPAIPKDRIVILALQASQTLPANKDDIGNPLFRSANFYLGGSFEDVKEKTESKTKERELTVKIVELLSKYDYAIEMANYLLIMGISDNMPIDNLDDLLTAHLDKKRSNKEEFMVAMKEKPEFIRLTNQFRKYRLKNLVTFEDGDFYSGKVKLAKTEKASVKKLLTQSPEMQSELSRLIEEYKELTTSKTDD